MPVAQPSPSALRSLQAISDASMLHQVTFETRVDVRLPSGEMTDTWVARRPVRGKLEAPSAQAAQLAAAQGIRLQWSLRVPLGDPGGDRALVRGITRGQRWQRLVEVTSDRGLTEQVHTMLAAVDADLG